MNVYEKLFSLVAVLALISLALIILYFPETRRFSILFPLAFAGIAVNAGLLFIVFRDIMTRSFSSEGRRYLWLVIVFLFFPSILMYLPLHGFKRRAPV